jgi:apolipoprotein N-acyltransferase
MERYLPLTIYPSHRLALLVLSLVFLVAVFELVRRELLRERYALLWLGIAGGAVVFGVFPGLVAWLAVTFHFQYLTVILMLSFLFTLALVMGLSVVVSRQSDRNRSLAQEVALLGNQVANLEARLSDADRS